MTSLIHIFRHSFRRSLLSPIFSSLSFLSCAAVLSTGCAGVPTKITNPVLTARSDQYLQKWITKAGDDAVQHLADYLRVDTTNPSETRREMNCGVHNIWLKFHKRRHLVRDPAFC